MIYAVLVSHQISIDEETHLEFNFRSKEQRDRGFEGAKRNYSSWEGFQDSGDSFSYKHPSKGCITSHTKIEIKEDDNSRDWTQTQ